MPDIPKAINPLQLKLLINLLPLLILLIDAFYEVCIQSFKIFQTFLGGLEALSFVSDFQNLSETSNQSTIFTDDCTVLVVFLSRRNALPVNASRLFITYLQDFAQLFNRDRSTFLAVLSYISSKMYPAMLSNNYRVSTQATFVRMVNCSCVVGAKSEQHG